ncbi:MAG: hypothetical protein QG641_2408 [Candidatus Poribacteria bacterium]|nr:hypothetical protein [Candidatus Poribacteria bacterium]
MRLLVKIFFSVLLVYLVVGTANAADVTKDIVSYWSLDGNAKDSVGGFDGEKVGGVNWVQAHKGQGAELDGKSSINVPKFKLTTNVITFSAWIKGWKVTDWAGIVGTRMPSGCEMIFGDSNTVHYVWNNDAGDTWGWGGAPAIPQDKWAMVALTIDPEKAVAYVYSDDTGLKSGANKIKHLEQTMGNINIGWVDCCGGTRYFKGIIDEVIIYNRALSEEDINQLATKGLFAPVENNGKLTVTWGMIKH